MEERTYTSYYRPLSLVQRSEVASHGRATSSRDEYVRRESAYARGRERMGAYATDTDSTGSAPERYGTGRRSFRVVEGERDTTEAEATSFDRDSSRRQRRADDARRSGRGSYAARPRRVSRVEDDFDDYYASWDDDPEEYEEYDEFEEYDEYEDDDAEDDYGSNPYGDREPMHGRAGRARSHRGGTRPAPARRPAVRVPFFSLVEILASPVWATRDLVVYHTRFCAFVLAVALALAMLFAPVRELYIAHRQLDDLQATYDALEAENKAILDEINYLQTDDGIETEARRRGYVAEGETKVVVEGFPETEDTDPTSTPVSSEVADNRSWVVRFFDRVFGYEVGE